VLAIHLCLERNPHVGLPGWHRDLLVGIHIGGAPTSPAGAGVLIGITGRRVTDVEAGISSRGGRGTAHTPAIRMSGAIHKHPTMCAFKAAICGRINKGCRLSHQAYRKARTDYNMGSHKLFKQHI